MGNIQGRKHRRARKTRKSKKVVCNKLVFVDREDGQYVWEIHAYGRLPFKEPEEVEIVFYADKLWQDDDGWSMLVWPDEDVYELSDVEVELE